MINNLKDLIEFNENGIYRNIPNMQDFKNVSFLANIIENNRSYWEPRPGDIIICRGPKRTYLNGHMEVSDPVSICTSPMIPFAGIVGAIHDTPTNVTFDTSGGYWFGCEKSIFVKENCKQDKQFWTWGRRGREAGGGIHFKASVNVWSVTLESIY